MQTTSKNATVSGIVEYGIAPPEYRLPAATRLGAVRLQVADFARSLPYYEQVLGLRTLARGNGVATLGVRHDPDPKPLVELCERPGVNSIPRHGRRGLYHYAILLPNRAMLGRFIRHLTEIGEYAGMSDHLVSEAVYLTDPDGLGIEVYADRPRSTWRHQDRQLVMATDTLDMGDVLQAAGHERWTGMPAGTTMGHLHLFVADLDDAARFYHHGLGFDKMVWNYPGALFLAAGGYHHHLGVNTWAAGAPAAGENDARLLEWELVVPAAADASAALDSLARIGVTVARTSDGGVVHDPWGTALRIRAADEVS